MLGSSDRRPILAKIDKKTMPTDTTDTTKTTEKTRNTRTPNATRIPKATGTAGIARTAGRASTGTAAVADLARTVVTARAVDTTLAESAGKSEQLTLMMEMQRLMMSRVYGGAANEWLRLELTTGQFKLLMWLTGAGAQPMSRIAHTLGIGLPAATNLVDKLVDAALVTREHSSTDRRVVLVQVSPEGEALAGRLRQVHADQLRQILTFVPEQDLPTLCAGTRIMVAALRRCLAATDTTRESGN